MFWLGVALSQVGTRATAAANLWQIQELTDSTLAVGLVSLCEGTTVIALAAFGGAIADRFDRRRLLQLSQFASLVASLALVWLTVAGTISPLWIYVAATVVAAAATIDTPTRQALVPALVARNQIADAYVLIAPIGNLSRLLGPAIAGLLIAEWGAGAVYAFDVVTYLALVLILAVLVFEHTPAPPQGFLLSIAEGLQYVRSKPLIWHLMLLDFFANLFGSYRVLLPSLARDVFKVGAPGYGLLSVVPALGGILGAVAVFRGHVVKKRGLLVLASTALYALCAMGLGYAPDFVVAVLLAGALGFFDAIAMTVRQVVTQLETPDRLRGRVSSLYQITARGGPALGQAQLGASAAILGAPLALGVGSALTLACTAWLGLTRRTIRTYDS